MNEISATELLALGVCFICICLGLSCCEYTDYKTDLMKTERLILQQQIPQTK